MTTTNTNEQPIQFVKMNVQSTLGLASQVFDFEMYGLSQAFPDQPRLIDYHFDADAVDCLLAWYNRKGSKDGYFIHGPAGCGKTSLPEQLFARFNLPVYKLECHEFTESYELIGSMVAAIGPNNDQIWRWNEGPLCKAMRNGGIFIMDEFDRLPPGITSILHDVLDGKSLFVPATGETIQPHPMFKMIATGNSSGSGDESGLHPAVQHQDMAILDRFWSIKADYLSVDDEMAILTKVSPNIPEDIRLLMISVANKVRDQHVSKNGDLPLVFSTRTLCRWASMANDNSRWSLSQCLKISLTNRASNDAFADAIDKIGFALFGQAWNE